MGCAARRQHFRALNTEGPGACVPWPRFIRVTIAPHKGEGADSNATRAVKTEPIEAVVERVADQTKSVRYRPVGEESAWEIGEPYVPRDLLSSLATGVPSALNVVVEWDLTGPFTSTVAG